MKKIFLLSATLTLLFLSVFYIKQNATQTAQKITSNSSTEVETPIENDEIQNGDLIFHASLSTQSKAIQFVTGSPYSHCGIIYKEGADYFVFEAVQPVKSTPLEDWIKRGEDGKYVIKRLKNATEILTPQVLSKMKEIGNQFVGRNYDLAFEWSDNKVYCSELIWKIYQRATGLEIGKVQQFKDFDLSNELIQKMIKERYGDDFPMEEKVVTPAAIFESPLLVEVELN